MAAADETMVEVEIDVVVNDDETAQDALSDMTSGHGLVYWAVVKEFGPAGGNTVAKLWGPRADVNRVLRAGGYDEVK